MGKIVSALKDRALAGYQYEAAEASFVLLVEKILGKYKNSFDLISYKIISEQPAIEGKVASAIVKIRVGGVTKIAAADGEGPRARDGPCAARSPFRLLPRDRAHVAGRLLRCACSTRTRRPPPRCAC